MKLHLRRAAVALFVIASSVSTITHAAAVSGQGTWETTLQGRDLDGNRTTSEAYYDTVLNITWLADTNYAQTSGYDTDGRMTWVVANAWAAGLNPYSSGVTGWRLPIVTDIGVPGCENPDNFYAGTDCGFNVDTATGEMAHMYYSTMGNKAYFTPNGLEQPGWGLTNTGPFGNFQFPSYSLV